MIEMRPPGPLKCAHERVGPGPFAHGAWAGANECQGHRAPRDLIHVLQRRGLQYPGPKWRTAGGFGCHPVAAASHTRCSTNRSPYSRSLQARGGTHSCDGGGWPTQTEPSVATRTRVSQPAAATSGCRNNAHRSRPRLRLGYGGARSRALARPPSRSLPSPSAGVCTPPLNCAGVSAVDLLIDFEIQKRDESTDLARPHTEWFRQARTPTTSS